MVETAIIEILKQGAHFLVPLFIMIVLRQCRMPVLIALALSFSCVSAKEIVDAHVIHLIEYDDLTLNAIGAMIGALV